MATFRSGDSVRFMGHSNSVPNGHYGKVVEKPTNYTPFTRSAHADKNGTFIHTVFKVNGENIAIPMRADELIVEKPPRKKRSSSLSGQSISDILTDLIDMELADFDF